MLDAACDLVGVDADRIAGRIAGDRSPDQSDPAVRGARIRWIRTAAVASRGVHLETDRCLWSCGRVRHGSGNGVGAAVDRRIEGTRRVIRIAAGLIGAVEHAAIHGLNSIIVLRTRRGALTALWEVLVGGVVDPGNRG